LRKIFHGTKSIKRNPLLGMRRGRKEGREGQRRGRGGKSNFPTMTVRLFVLGWLAPVTSSLAAAASPMCCAGLSNFFRVNRGIKRVPDAVISIFKSVLFRAICSVEFELFAKGNIA